MHHAVGHWHNWHILSFTHHVCIKTIDRITSSIVYSVNRSKYIKTNQQQDLNINKQTSFRLSRHAMKETAQLDEQQNSLRVGIH